MKSKKLFWPMAAASAIGLAATFWQLMEKITLLKNKDAILSCNYNSTFSCSNVLNAHQASIFGPPNSVIGMIMFTFFLTIAIVALSGSKLSKRLSLIVQGLALFMAGFTLWFLFQSTYRIQSVCVFCLFSGSAVVVINAAILRHNVEFLPKLKLLTKRGADLFGWALIWLVVAFAMLLKFT